MKTNYICAEPRIIQNELLSENNNEVLMSLFEAKHIRR